MFKINIQLFTAEGPPAVEKLAAMGPGVFLDLKFHDIPNTVKGAVSSAARLAGLELLDLHALGGPEMMQAAAKARDEANRSNPPLPKLLAITILTSMDNSALRRVGVEGPASRRVVQLARLAQRNGMDGVVASPHEIRAIRRACGQDFLIVVPGIRPAAAPGPARGGKTRKDDQARIATPSEAIRAGADYLVVGRPITAAPNPQSAARAIVEEIESALPAPLSHRAGRA
jgi:orotidine-5'-phosphate decarboxylase